MLRGCVGVLRGCGVPVCESSFMGVWMVVVRLLFELSCVGGGGEPAEGKRCAVEACTALDERPVRWALC